MASADETNQQPILFAFVAEGLGTAAISASLTLALPATAWTSIINDGLPLIFQSIFLTGVTAFSMLSLSTVSGGHLNPLLSMSYGVERRQDWTDVTLYSIAQTFGAVMAILSVGSFFGLHSSNATPQHLTEIRLIAEYFSGLILILVLISMRNQRATEAALGASIAIAITFWLSSGTMTINPALTVALGLASGDLNPGYVGPIVLVQFAGALSGLALGRILWR